MQTQRQSYWLSTHLLHCPDIPLSYIAPSRTDQTNHRTGLTGVNPLTCSDRDNPSEPLQFPTEQHGETPGLILFLYEWLTCVCKVLYWTKGKGNKCSGEGYSSLFVSSWLTRGLVEIPVSRPGSSLMSFLLNLRSSNDKICPPPKQKNSKRNRTLNPSGRTSSTACWRCPGGSGW